MLPHRKFYVVLLLCMIAIMLTLGWKSLFMRDAVTGSNRLDSHDSRANVAAESNGEDGKGVEESAEIKATPLADNSSDLNANDTGSLSSSSSSPTSFVSNESQATQPTTMAAVSESAEVKAEDAASAPPSSTSSSSSPSSANDAAENKRLMNELQWTFGGKAQRGWYLYVALIGKLINSDANPESEEFANAVRRWQNTVQLPTTGIINEETLLRMANTWQSRRRKDSTYPPPDRLLTAPSSDFWDISRAEELRKVERDTYAAYKQMVAAAAADKSLGLKTDANGELAPDERRLRIVSAYRSREYQDRLRQQTPNAGRAGLAVNSPHFTGRALDLYIAGDPVDTKDGNRFLQVNTPVYRWLVRNAERFGFYPYFYEPWHWEHQ